jgi:hypothetical protein
MLVIRRMDDGRRSYTAMFLPGEEPRIFPTSDREHARILEIFKQDKRYQDVLNDFTDYDLAPEAAESPGPQARPVAAKRPPVARRRRAS